MTEHIEPEQPSDYSGVFMKGTAWAISMRWAMRLLGLISTAVLARLLVPADFGLVAMALVVVGLSESLLNFGTDLAILRNKDATRADIDTAWTLQIGQACLAAVIVLLVSLGASSFFKDERVGIIIQVAAISIIVQGFQNIGVTLFRKQFQFQKDFLFHFLHKSLSVTLTVAFAFIFRNYWALVFGQLAATSSATILSYVMSDYRPRFSFQKFRSIFDFSRWIVVLSLGQYSLTSGDRVIFGRLAGAADLGVYSIAKEISYMVTVELVSPITRALLPALAQMKDDAKRFERAFLMSLGGSMSIAAPASIGLAMVAGEFVPLLLGPGWMAVVPFLQILCLTAFSQTFVGLCNNALLVLNRGGLVAAFCWLQALLILGGVYIGYQAYGMLEAVYFILAATIFTGFMLAAVSIHCGMVSLSGLLRFVWRPFAASVLMVIAILQLVPYLSDHAPINVMLIKTLVGAFVYGSSLLTLWIIAGRPDGLESRIILWISGRLDTRGPLSPTIPVSHQDPAGPSEFDKE